MTFKIGDKVKVKCKYSDDWHCAWVRQMDKTIDKEGVVIHTGKSVCVKFTDGDAWHYSSSSLELVKSKPKFNPKPGDIIVTKNKRRYECVTKEDYRGSHSVGDTILGNYIGRCGHQSWKSDGIANFDHDFSIEEIIPKRLPEPAVYSVRQVAEAIHAVTGVPKLPDFEGKIELLNKHLSKVTDPDWAEYQRLKEKFEVSYSATDYKE